MTGQLDLAPPMTVQPVERDLAVRLVQRADDQLVGDQGHTTVSHGHRVGALRDNLFPA